MIPLVAVEEEKFEFGGVTFGDSKTLPLSLINESNIDAKVVLDLREYPEFELRAIAANQTGAEEDGIITADLDPEVVQPMSDPVET